METVLLQKIIDLLTTALASIIEGMAEVVQTINNVSDDISDY